MLFRDPTPQTARLRRRALIGVLLLLGAIGALAATAFAQQQPSAPAQAPVAAAAQNQTPPSATPAPAPAAPAVAVAPVPLTPGTTRAQEDRAIDFADSLSTAFAAVAERVSPSVVSIRVEVPRAPRESMGRSPGGVQIPGLPFPLPFPFGGEAGPPGGRDDGGVGVGGGSGVVLTEDGAILTNAHVVGDAERIDVRLQDGRTFRAELAGLDRAVDLAVIRIPARGLTPARFASGARPRVGEWVVAIGSPFGLDYTVTAGIVSATGRGGLGQMPIEDFVQTDARINPGNSGGPLVNLRSEVVGINTMILGRDSGIGFAVSAPLAVNVGQQLRTTGRVARSFVGVGFQELTPELAAGFGISGRRGALVSSVSNASPAERSGIRPGDVITAVNGVAVSEDRDFLREVLRSPVGSRLMLDVVRDARPMRVEVTTVERTDLASADPPRPRPDTSRRRQAQQGSFGLSLSEMTPALAQQLGPAAARGGVVVTGIEDASPSDRAGLRAGDVIVEADRREARTTSDLLRAIQDGHALLRVQRRDGSFYTVLTRD